MLKENQLIKVSWHNKTKEHYEFLGYSFTKYRDYFYVKAEDLSKGSHQLVEYYCDYCNELKVDSYKTYLYKLENSVIKKDCCKACVNEKNIETNLLIYGVPYPNQREDVRNKTEKTNLDRYGAKSPLSNDSVKLKVKETNIKKYGVEHPLQNKDVLEKVIQTNNIRYGGNSPSCCEEVVSKLMQTMVDRYGGIGRGSEEIAEKINNTNLTKYGRTTMITDPKVREKANRSLKLNKKAKSSKQQEYIHSVTGGYYNYPINYYLLDIAFEDDLIYIEFDGSGHDMPVRMGNMSADEFKEKEHNRFIHMRKLGWREIRIISIKDKLPSKNELSSLINSSYEKLKNDESIVKITLNLEDLGLELKTVDKLRKGDN